MLERLGARPAGDCVRQLLRQLRCVPCRRVAGSPCSGQLSARETEIAQLVAEGLSNPEIAERLFISQRTVTTHLQRIYQRLGAQLWTGLTRYVVEHLSPDPPKNEGRTMPEHRPEAPPSKPEGGGAI